MNSLSDTDPTSIGSYRLLGVLGNGGMGRVYLAQSRSGRPVAIKVIRPDLVDDPVIRQRFTREVAAVRAVNPLFTAAVVDADLAASEPWLATTYIEGPSLERWVDGHGALSPGSVLTLTAGLAEALASIHAAGLVHRDLKPSNVLLGDVGPYIIDFGVVLSPKATRMTSSLVVGTPSYMAPERIHGGAATPATDIFSLGATMYYAATGRPLVDETDTVYAQMMRIIKGRFELGRVPAELRPLVTRCVSAEPRERPTAAELSRMLFAAGVSAPEPGWHQAISDVPFSAVLTPRRITRMSRRRLLMAGGLVGVAAAGGTVAGLVGRWSGRAGPVAPGTVAWTARSGMVGPPAPSGVVGGPAPSGAAGWVPPVAFRSGTVVASTADGVRAVDATGRERWRRPVSGRVTLHRWERSVLVADERQLTRLDPAGTVLSSADLSSADLSFADLSSAGGPGATGVVVAADRVYVGPAAYGPALEPLWRSDPAGVPLAADPTAVVMYERDAGSVRISLHDAVTGRPQWTREFAAPAVVTDATGPPPGDPPSGGGPPPGHGGPPGGPQPGGPGGPEPPPGWRPPYDRNWNATEALLGAGHVLLRDAAEIRVLRRDDGGEVWAYTSPVPVTDVALTGDLLVTAADRLTARRLTTGEVRWQAPPPGCRVVLAHDRQVVAAGPEGRVWARDLAGAELWRVDLPPQTRPALPDTLLVDGDQVLLTMAPPPGTQLEPGTVDVLGLAL